MSNRRQVILSGLAGAGALIAPPLGFAAQPSAALYRVIYDDRFAEGRAFSQQASRLGHHTRAIQGDVTALWYDDLYHRWKQGPAAIAGLTTVSAFFCLETLAMDAGLRRVLHVEHRMSDGDIEHRMDGPAHLLRQAALADCGGAWAGRMAQLAARCPASRKDRMQATEISSAPVSAPRDTLISWVLAPLEPA